MKYYPNKKDNNPILDKLFFFRACLTDIYQNPENYKIWYDIGLFNTEKLTEDLSVEMELTFKFQDKEYKANVEEFFNTFQLKCDQIVREFELKKEEELRMFKEQKQMILLEAFNKLDSAVINFGKTIKE